MIFGILVPKGRGGCQKVMVQYQMRPTDPEEAIIILREQSDLMTLNHSTDKSYEVMLDALMVAIEHIRLINSPLEDNSEY
ncbi:hypothetical protein [Lyngbya aestuarii]|uniref:hypothetical protein n=1 Tax=Lyngbya aestuarii TaxID=118322 RepID=UPI00403DDDCA